MMTEGKGVEGKKTEAAIAEFRAQGPQEYEEARKTQEQGVNALYGALLLWCAQKQVSAQTRWLPHFLPGPLALSLSVDGDGQGIEFTPGIDHVLVGGRDKKARWVWVDTSTGGQWYWRTGHDKPWPATSEGIARFFAYFWGLEVQPHAEPAEEASEKISTAEWMRKDPNSPFCFKVPSWANARTPGDPTEQLKRGRELTQAVYALATKTGVHALIEWCGIMGEHVKILQEAHLAGIEPNGVDQHTGVTFAVPPYMVEYFCEKLGCQIKPFIHAAPEVWQREIAKWFPK